MPNLVETLSRRLQRLASRIVPGFGQPAETDDPRIIELTRTMQSYRKEAQCRQHIGNVAARYFIKHERTPEIAIPFEDVTIDSNPEWMAGVLEKRELSEPEFAVFGCFDDPATTILDLGAHFGYSAASIWAAGSNAAVVSFEPNPWHWPCLQAIKSARPGRYDFVRMGLGRARQAIRFVVPVVEGVGVSGLSSAAIESEMDWAIPENVLRYMMDYLPDVAAPRLQFSATDWEVAPLDDLLDSTPLDVTLETIAAIKIDVEGYEPAVIEGAMRTLVRHKPFLMIEGANRHADVLEPLRRLGYRYADLHGNAARLTEEVSSRVGGFYLHVSRFDEYRRMGLLIA